MTTTRDKVERLTARGLSRSQIARELSVTRNTVDYHLKRLANGASPESKGTVELPADNGIRTVRTREAVDALIRDGMSRAAIAKKLGLSKSTVSYHARRLDHPIDERANRRYDWSLVQRFYDAGHSARDCRAHFGMSAKTWHDARQRGALKTRPQAKPIELLLATATSRSAIRRRILAERLLEPVCAACGIDEWLDAPISLQLHHINGDGADNRLENLQLLCPNCHAQTDNWAGRNRARLRVVSDEEVA